MSPDPSDLGFARAVMNAETRDDLIEAFASYRIVPKRNPMQGSGVAKSEFILERRGQRKPGGKKHAIGEKTRQSAIEELKIDSEEECKQVREEIKNDPKWD